MTPYLVSPAAEAFEPVAGVPASAWLRAYDLERPTAAPAPLPADATRFAAQAGGMKVLGAATGGASGRRDRWAFFVAGPPQALKIISHTRNGPEQLSIPPEAVLRNPGRLTAAAWFIIPTLGPRRSEVRALEFPGGPVITLEVRERFLRLRDFQRLCGLEREREFIDKSLQAVEDP